MWGVDTGKGIPTIDAGGTGSAITVIAEVFRITGINLANPTIAEITASYARKLYLIEKKASGSSEAVFFECANATDPPFPPPGCQVWACPDGWEYCWGSECIIPELFVSAKELYDNPTNRKYLGRLIRAQMEGAGTISILWEE